jgi:chitinase
MLTRPAHMDAEINRIIAEHNLTPEFDATAAVNWITWDSNQWVSYDDQRTTQMKISKANELVSSHPAAIWSID